MSKIESEEWREVPGSQYEVSSLGRVRSWHNNRHGRRAEPKLLSLCPGTHGYLTFSMHVDGRQITSTVHRVVAKVFLGPVPEGLQVCHNDGDKLNNSATNLRYDTHAANLAERIMPRGERHHRSLLTESDALEVRRLRNECGWKLRELAEKFGVSISTIFAITTRRSWAHI